VSPFFDESRPKLTPWRWNALPQRGVEKTIFSKCDPTKIQIDKDSLIEIFKVKEVVKKEAGGEDGEDGDGDESSGASAAATAKQQRVRLSLF